MNLDTFEKYCSNYFQCFVILYPILIFSRGDSSSKYSATLDKIVDVTIAYPDGKPLGLFDILSAWREPCTTHVHYKIYDINEVSINSQVICPT